MECCIPLPFGRVSLQRFISYNVARTYDWVSNPWYMGKFAGSAVPSPGTHRRYFENVLVDHEQVFFAVCVSEFFIGNAGLKYFEGDCCEYWYYIVNELQRGKGYAKENVNLLCRVAFSIEGVVRVKASVLKTNPKSSKALLSNGFTERGRFADEKKRVFIMYEKRNWQDENGEYFTKESLNTH